MDVIPVIDLKGGLVVHARRGERDRYAPIVSPLAPTSDPVDVASGLLSIFPFPALYVADLDAIARTGDNHAALKRLKAAFPRVTLWIDCGIADRGVAEAWLGAGVDHLVIGSETQPDAALPRRFTHHPRVVLSLDFRAAAFEGPGELLHDSACWPRRVIVMTLTRVGSDAGPDLERLGAIREAAGARRIYAAGGVRDRGDLLMLRHAGMAGALVASCLHNGSLRGADIATLPAAE
jgi:phosphoribosylformimino-5-aminoimidazole carboxamide ribotide isomerase